MISERYMPLRQSKLKFGAGYELAGTSSVKKVDLDSSAIDVMTDLRRIEALTTTEDVSIDDAQKMMIDYGVRSLIVVDIDHKVAGIITATDILSDKPMQHIHERGLRHSDLTVGDIMTPATALDVIDLKDVLLACVGQVLETLTQHRRQHALVVDQAEDGHQRVCGIFSSTQIARQMSC